MTTADVKILIVDDEPRNLDALEVMLESTGCALVRAQSADEALLAMLRHEFEFAAMILDIRMPGMNGIELAHLVKQRRRTQDVPILFLTAHLVEENDVLLGYGVGAVDYLSKPVNADILRSKVAVFVDLFRKTRALAVLNDALQNEIGQRQQAQETLQQLNEELELRVAERTAALTVAHRGVRENEARLTLAMDLARTAAWECDLETRRMTWSTDPEKLFGFPAGAFGPDLRLLTVLHDEDRGRAEQCFEEAATTGSHYECEYRAIRPDGECVWIAERGRVLRDDAGGVEKMVGVSRDVSDQRRATREREGLLDRERRARDEAERQSRLKDDFLATLSHELRTPMNAILGWLSMLADGQAVQDPAHVIAVIRRNAEAQAKLIEDLLEMNKLTSGEVRLDVGSVDLAVALESALSSLQPAATAKQVLLVGTVDPGLPPLPADGRRVQQILWNLIHNAVKFTPPGGRVEVAISQTNGAVSIAVRDTGEGIAQDFLPYVFDRFRQADPSTTRKAWGLGIGLSITKQLVELHGGSIHASSDGPQRGATFLVVLPATSAHAGPPDLEGSKLRVPAVPEESSGRP